MESPMSSLATELLEEILRHLELCHLLHAQLVCKRWAEVELIIIFSKWQASQIVAKQHLTPYLLSQDWSVQRHLHKEVYTISNMELIAWRIYLQNWHENSHWTLTCRLFRFDSSKPKLSSIQEERFRGKRTVVYIVYTLPQESLPWNS